MAGRKFQVWVPESLQRREGRAKLSQLVVYLPPSERALLERVAGAEGESMTVVVRSALRPYLRKRERELGVTACPACDSKG